MNQPCEETLLKPFKCSYDNCTWAFTCQSKLDRHLPVHTGEKNYKCATCEKKFARHSNLIAHEKLHNKNIECNYKDCGQEFEHRKDLSNQTEQQHTFPCKCPRKRCLKLFYSQTELQEHLLNHSQQYGCSYPNCGKRFSKPFLLQQHTFIHTNEKPHKCDYASCKKSFATPQKLQRHKAVHENNKLFTCSYKDCGKSFNLQDYLTAHKRTHEEFKPFKCPIENCGKHFVCAATLKVHLQKHADIRPYKCTYSGCSKTYLTLSNLRVHEKTHTTKRQNSFTSTIATTTANEIETVELNDFINSPLDIPDVSILSNDIMSREELVAATFGEFVCGQYINEETLSSPSHMQHEGNHKEYAVDVFNDSDKEKLKDLQEEFVRNIYASSVNTDHSFLPSTSYKEIDTSIAFIPQLPTTTVSDISAPESSSLKSSSNIVTVTLEPSMELSTGHLEIDGAACFEARSCMPDHIYSNQVYGNSSTVNVQDIR